jgi:hypothetical protein
MRSRRSTKSRTNVNGSCSRPEALQSEEIISQAQIEAEEVGDVAE